MDCVTRIGATAVVLAALAATTGCAAVDRFLTPKPKADSPAGAPASGGAAPATDLRPETAAAPTPFDPKRLIGLDTAATQDLLGAPDEVREGNPATVWHYKARDCALDVYFYADLGAQALRALAYDVTTAQPIADERSVKACAGRIRADYRDGKR